MKKLWFLVLIPVVAVAGLVAWQASPSKRYAKHMTKARLFAKERNYTAARLEYEKAYDAQGGYSPYASLEVLSLTNRMNLQDKKPQDALNNTRMFVQQHPDSKEGKLMLAELAFQMGETETAFGAIDGLLQQDPWSFPGRLLLTSVRARQGRLDLAEEQLRYLYSKYPDSVQALLPLAEILLDQGRTADSRQFLGQVIAKDPKNARARMLLADSYIKDRKIDSAQATLDAWKEADPDRLQDLQIRKARLYSLNNQPDQALAALSAYREVKQDNIRALFETAILHVIAGRYDSALALYKAVGEAVPAARAAAENNSLYLHLKNQNPARALEALKALQIGDKRPALMRPLLAAYIAIGQDNKAQEYVAQQPDSLKAPLNQFLADLQPDKDFIGDWALLNYYTQNRQDYQAFKTGQALYQKWPKNRMAIELYTSLLSASGARAEAAKILSTLPNPTLTHQVALLQLYVSTAQADKAAALAEKLAKEHPDIKGVNTILADFWMKKDKAKAIGYYEKELAASPDNTVALNNLAWEYGVVQGNLEKAKPYLEKLKALNHLDPRILDTVGWILAVNGQGKEAERYIRNALDLVPDFPSFQYHLAFVLNQTGNKDEARKYLDSALSSKAPFEERKDAEKLRAQLG